MTDRPSRPLPVPSGRLNRFARMGSMATGVAGNMAVSALKDVGRGKRPEVRNLLLTPGNMRRMADELARMRGAAMKVGQLISMDAGDVLPAELADIMARLRDQAHFMPPKQLKHVLTENWDAGWLGAFARFDVHPIAAASIGQVHRGRLKDGRDLAIKVQYPGIARSIDSDVSNVGALVRISGLLPKGFDLAPYLDEARKQLHEETDYAREGRCLQTFGDLLARDARFEVPAFHEDWSTGDILAMSFVDGAAIETLADADQTTRNRTVATLIDLTLREVFEFGVTQSDPNFANYRYNAATGKIILLDFGATRHLDPQLTETYRDLMRAGLSGDRTAIKTAAQALRLLDGGQFNTQILEMIEIVFEAINTRDTFNFRDPTLSQTLNTKGMALAEAGYVPPDVPMDVLYLQRKFGGMFLLASRLGASLALRPMLERYL